MRDFYAASSPMPLATTAAAGSYLDSEAGRLQDQAAGLRRLFAGRQRQLLALVANPHVAFSGLVLDRLATRLAADGARVLVVDAASTSPAPHELAELDLAACVEPIGERVAYLPARGLPLSHVDTRGSSARFVDALESAVPGAQVILIHADGVDLARMFRHRALRPVLLGADQPESIKHAYASAKLLAQRAGLMSFDLLLAAAANSPRVSAITEGLRGCADTFLGAVLRHAAVLDPASDPDELAADAALARLLGAQLSHESAAAPAARPFTATDAHVLR